MQYFIVLSQWHRFILWSDSNPFDGSWWHPSQCKSILNLHDLTPQKRTLVDLEIFVCICVQEVTISQKCNPDMLLQKCYVGGWSTNKDSTKKRHHQTPLIWRTGRIHETNLRTHSWRVDIHHRLHLQNTNKLRSLYVCDKKKWEATKLWKESTCQHKSCDILSGLEKHSKDRGGWHSRR